MRKKIGVQGSHIDFLIYSVALRLDQNREFFDIAAAQMEELYQFVAGAGFAVNIAKYKLMLELIELI